MIKSLIDACLWFPSIKAWCLQVTLIPDDKRTIVFNNGTEKGLNGWSPLGGQSLPRSTLGLRELWKKAQKNDTKKNTSETINKIIPQRNPSSTTDVWIPWKAPSRLTSRHHWKTIKTKKKEKKRHKMHLIEEIFLRVQR